MKQQIALAISHHESQARIFSRLACDNLAVAQHEVGHTPASLNRKKEYLGYAEDYSLIAHKELTKAYRLLHNELHIASLPVNK